MYKYLQWIPARILYPMLIQDLHCCIIKLTVTGNEISIIIITCKRAAPVSYVLHRYVNDQESSLLILFGTFSRRIFNVQHRHLHGNPNSRIIKVSNSTPIFIIIHCSCVVCLIRMVFVHNRKHHSPQFSDPSAKEKNEKVNK